MLGKYKGNIKVKKSEMPFMALFQVRKNPNKEKNMKKLKFLMSCVLCFQISHAFAVEVIEAMDDAGDVVALWEDLDPVTSNPAIIGAIYTGGVWSSPTTISDNTTVSFGAIVTINRAGDVVAGWLQVDTVNEVEAFYAAFADASTATWTLPGQRISTITDNVTLINLDISNPTTGTPTVVATYDSYIGSDSFASERANTATFGGTWSTPQTISAE